MTNRNPDQTATRKTITDEVKSERPPTPVVTGLSRNPGDTTRKWNGCRCLGSYAATLPLIILDGKVYEGTLESIDAATIAQILILKEVTAKALYGTKAAAGAIVIQSSTKKTPAQRQ